jgi:hypothetical protein
VTQTLQVVDGDTQGETSGVDLQGRLRECHDVSGLTLTDRQLMDVLNLKKSSFFAKKAKGLFRFLEVEPRLGRTEYSGLLVQRWRDGAGRPQGRSLRAVKAVGQR